MARTAGSKEQSRRTRISYGLFVLGVFLLVAGLVLSVNALQFEFKQGTSGDGAGQSRVYEYEMLTAQEQHVVDGALEGKTYVFDTSEPLPGYPTPGLQPKTVKVNARGRDPRVHLSNRLPGDGTERAGDHRTHRRRPAGDGRSGSSPPLPEVVAVADQLRTVLSMENRLIARRSR